MDVTEIAGSLIVEEKKLLLIYRKEEGWWELPGGKVKEDESPTQAAVRETREEISVEVNLEKPFYSGEFQHNDELFLWHGYLAEVKEDETPQLSEEKFDRKKWFRKPDLEEEDLAPNLRQVEPALRNILRE